MSARSRFFACSSFILLLAASSGALAADSSLVGWWNFDEGSGTVAGDSSGNGHSGTIVGAEWIAEGWNQMGHCLEFLYAGGEGDLIDLGTMDVFGEGITITAWINPYSFSRHDARIISKSSTAATGDGHWWMLGTNSGVNVRFRLKTDESSSTLTLIDTAGTLVTEEWQFITARWDGTTATTYVNTVETGRAAKGGTAVATDASVPVAIGNQPAAAGDGPRGWDGLLDDIRVYNRALTLEELDEVMMGAGPGSSTELAYAPIPGDKQMDVPFYVALNWTPGKFADTHDVYLGTSKDDVEAANRANPLGVLMGQGQDSNAFDPEGLDFDTTYYWRVDEVNSPPDSTIFEGPVWEFVTEPVAYPVTNVTAAASSVHETGMEADRTVDESGLNANNEHSADLAHMWLSNTAETEGVWIQYDLGKVYKLNHAHVWNHNSQTEMVLGYGIKEAIIETSEDGDNWTELMTAGIPQAIGLGTYMGTDVALDGAMAQYVRITALSNHSILGLKQFGLSEVRFYYIPVLAREPNPTDSATSDGVDVTLTWRAGREAAEHEVVFSDNEQDVIDGSAVVGTVDELAFDLGTLDLGMEFFWKINSVGDTPYEGDLWSFLTPDQIMIDDFEMYQAQEGLFIWEHWIDGFDNPAENGAVVGNEDDPETAEVYEGSQSMPLAYNNTAAPKSEAKRIFDPPLDLAAGNPESIEVYVKGIPYVVVGSYSVDGSSWTDLQWNPPVELGEDLYIGLAVTSHDVDSVATATIDSVSTTGNVTGDWTQADIGGTQPSENFTEANGTFTIPALGADIWGTADDFRFVYKQLSGLGSLTAKVGSLDGTNAWCKAGVMIRDALTADSSHSFMAATGTNGVHLQGRMSHGAGSAQDADNGDLDGTQEIMEEPVWVKIERKAGNGAAPITMTLTDSSGKSAMIETDAAATTSGSWTLLSAAPADLNVNLSQIEAITIGVDSAGVQGKIFVDAIRIAKPYPAPAPTE